MKSIVLLLAQTNLLVSIYQKYKIALSIVPLVDRQLLLLQILKMKKSKPIYFFSPGSSLNQSQTERVELDRMTDSGVISI